MHEWLYFKNLVDREKRKLLPVRINQLFCHAKSEPKNVIAITIENKNARNNNPLQQLLLTVTLLIKHDDQLIIRSNLDLNLR